MPQIYQMDMKYTKIAIKILNGRTLYQNALKMPNAH
jgi:hypothetical protein